MSIGTTASDGLASHGSRDVALIDLVDRLLAGGVVLGGDITLAVADIDLVYVSLRALISSVPVTGAGR
ncbi:MAG: gas vesicle protein [Solirubrobacteraceae bacterium]